MRSPKPSAESVGGVLLYLRLRLLLSQSLYESILPCLILKARSRNWGVLNSLFQAKNQKGETVMQYEMQQTVLKREAC